MKRCIISILFLFPALLFSSELSKCVSLMKPRSFRPIINSTGLETGIFRVGGNNEPIFPFADNAAWDPVNEKILFIGAPHQIPWVWGFPVYDVAANNWRQGNRGPYFDPASQILTHSYDNITSVYGTGRMYFYTPTPNTHPQASTNAYCFNIYDVPTDSWSVEVIPNTMVRGAFSALNYFPDKNGLVYVNGGLVSFYDLGTGQWRVIGERTMGGIHNIGEYDPVHHVMMIGGGDAHLYLMDTLFNIRPIASAPVIVEVSSALLTCDPVTGTFIVWKSGMDSLYGYDVETDRWSAIVKSPVVNFEAAWAVATPVKEYGVIAFLTNYSWPLLFYKHADSPRAPTWCEHWRKENLNRLRSLY